MCFNPSPVRRVPSPNRYMAVARFCFCKNNKRTIDRRRMKADGATDLCAIVILDVNRRRSICNGLNTSVVQLQFFFAYFFFAFALFRSSRLVSIEGDRRLEGSSAQHAMCIYAVGIYT